MFSSTNLCHYASIINHLKKSGHKIPERVASDNALGEVKLAGPVRGPRREAVAHGRCAGVGGAAVAEVDRVVGHVNPLVDKVHRTLQFFIACNNIHNRDTLTTL